MGDNPRKKKKGGGPRRELQTLSGTRIYVGKKNAKNFLLLYFSLYKLYVNLSVN